MPDQQPHYKTLDILVRHGGWLSAVVFIAALLLTIATATVLWRAESLLIIAAGALASALLYLLLRSYVELVRVIVDMLLPK